MAGNGPHRPARARGTDPGKEDQFHRHLGYTAAPSGQKLDALWPVVSAGRKLTGQVWAE